MHDHADGRLQGLPVVTPAFHGKIQGKQIRMVVDGTVLLEYVVVIDADCRVIGPYWVGAARDFWVKLVDDGISTGIGVSMKFYWCHCNDFVIDIVW